MPNAVETLGDDAACTHPQQPAVFEIEQGKPLQAEVLQRRALDLLRQVGDHQRVEHPGANLGTMRMDHGDLHEADEHYNQALSLALGLGQIEAQALVLSNMGTLYWRLGQRDQAERLVHARLGAVALVWVAAGGRVYPGDARRLDR